MTPSPASPRPSTPNATPVGLMALIIAVIGGGLAVGFNVDIAPLDLWTYPVATVLAIIAIALAWWARSRGVRAEKAGGTFRGTMSLLAFGIALATLLFTLLPSVMFLMAQLRG